MAEIDRVRWHCRRGLLELDLVLSKFMDQRYESLNQTQKDVFTKLLAKSDDELWSLLSGRQTSSDAEIRQLIELFE